VVKNVFPDVKRGKREENQKALAKTRKQKNTKRKINNFTKYF